MKRSLIPPVKGTRDFYPDQMARRVWLYGKIGTVARRFGYQEYEGPILETIGLYAAKSGEELVKEQAFVLTDRGGDELALRPELTPTLARMVAQRQGEIPRPIRWWSFGPFWRYERPQKGRSREFFQWNIDLLGSDDLVADAELLAVAAGFFREVGLGPSEILLQVNDRRLMDRCLSDIGIGGDGRQTVFRLIDKRDKLSPEEWRSYAASLGLDDRRIGSLDALLGNRELWRESEPLVSLFRILEDLGAAEFVRFDPSVIRGLDYYTGIVFEARDPAGEFRAVLGGGRYDNLVADVGGEPISGVGFAMGDVVIGLLLQKLGLFPPAAGSPAQVLVTLFSPDLVGPSVRAAVRLREEGIDVEIYPEPAKMNKQLRYADQSGIPFAILLGPDEAAAGCYTLKEMRSGEQSRAGLLEIVARLRVRP